MRSNDTWKLSVHTDFLLRGESEGGYNMSPEELIEIRKRVEENGVRYGDSLADMRALLDEVDSLYIANVGLMNANATYRGVERNCSTCARLVDCSEDVLCAVQANHIIYTRWKQIDDLALRNTITRVEAAEHRAEAAEAERDAAIVSAGIAEAKLKLHRACDTTAERIEAQKQHIAHIQDALTRRNNELRELRKIVANPGGIAAFWRSESIRHQDTIAELHEELRRAKEGQE